MSSSGSVGERDAVVVPAIDAPSSLACLRSLAPRGIRTIVLAHSRSAPAVHSRYCDERIYLPSPQADFRGYADRLLELAMRPDVRTIIPVREADVYVLARDREQFAEHVGTPWPTFETLATVQDRLKLFAAADRAGVAAPETVPLSAVEDHSRRWVVKSRYSILTERYLGGEPEGKFASGEHAGADESLPPERPPMADESPPTDEPPASDGSLALDRSPTSDGSSAPDDAPESDEPLLTDGARRMHEPLVTDGSVETGTETCDMPPTTRYLQSGAVPDIESIVAEMGHEPIAQEYVDTPHEYGFFAMYDHGEPVATFQHRQRRGYSYAGGPSAFRESIDIPELSDAGLALLDELDWHGPAMVEFLRNEETGEFKLMEINPRFWSSLPFTVQAGADFPYYYWQLATGDRESIRPGYDVGMGGHLLRGEALYLHSVLTDDVELVDRPSVLGSVGSIGKSLLTQPRFDYLDLRDPWPFVQDCRNTVGAVLKR